MQFFRALFSWNWCLGVADISVCRQFFPTFILTPPHAAPLLLHSPPSIPPPFHPTRDYWFTHNLLFNIREQTFQNLCNLSISMGLSVHLQRGCACGSFCYTWIALKKFCLSKVSDQRSLKKETCLWAACFSIERAVLSGIHASSSETNWSLRWCFSS